MAPLTELEKALIIGFCVVGAAILLFLFAFVAICSLRSRCSREKKRDSDSDAESPRVGAKPPPLPPVPPSINAAATPSTTSENVSCISSPTSSPRSPAQPQRPPGELMTPCQSLIFPSAHSRYAAMRLGRSAWTAAYLPPPATTTAAHAPQYGALERGAAELEQRLDARYGSEQYRTRSSRGFEPIQEEMPPASDPFVARAQSRWHAGTPPSDRGSQTKLLGAAVESASNYDDVVSNPGGPPAGRGWSPRPGYAPYSQSAMEAARRRTQELYNARRAQSQLSSPHLSVAGSARPPSPRPPPMTTGRELIWSRTTGRPQTGSYVIGARSVVDETDAASFYRPTMAAGPASLPGGGASMYLQPEDARASTVGSQTMVVDAAIGSSEPSNRSDTPRERHLIGDAFRFLDEFDE